MWSPSQLGIESDSDIKGSLHWIIYRDGSGFTRPPMLPSNTASGDTVTAPTEVQCEPQDISIRSFIQAARLQRGTVCTNRNGDECTQQYEEKGSICGALHQRIRPGHSFWALPVMDNLDEKHHSHANLVHGFPQSQIHHQSINHTRGPIYCSSRQVGRRVQMSHAALPQKNDPRKIGPHWNHPQARLYAEVSVTPTR